MKKLFLFIIILMLFISIVMGQSGQTFNKYNKRSGNLYRDVKARKIGDVITVLINESTKSLNQSETSTNKENQLQAESGGGTGLLKFFPDLALDHSHSNKFSGRGRVESRGSFSSTMSVVIKEIRQDGNFLVTGSREIDSNGERRVTTITGIVRPEDITSNNSIYSSQIANVHIFYQGEGVVDSGNKPGIFTRLINWIF